MYSTHITCTKGQYIPHIIFLVIAKTWSISGGSAGLGKETALDLAKRGAKIIIASRNRVKAKQTINEIIGKKTILFIYLFIYLFSNIVVLCTFIYFK